MQLFLNLPIKAGMVLVLVDSTNTYKQLQPTRHRFFPNEGVEVPEKIGERFLKEKTRTSMEGNKIPFLSKDPYDGEWPVELDIVPRMPKRRTRAGELRPQGDPGTHVGRRLPANIGRKNTQSATEAIENDSFDLQLENDIAKGMPVGPQGQSSKLKDDGDERFTRIDRDDVSVGRKLKALAEKDFTEMKAAMVGQAVKLLGFKLTDGLALDVRQEALETMCEIVSKEVEIPK